MNPSIVIGLREVADRVGLTIQAVRRDILLDLLRPAGFTRHPKSHQQAYYFDSAEVANYARYKTEFFRVQQRAQRIIEYLKDHSIDEAARRFRIKRQSVRRTVQRFEKKTRNRLDKAPPPMYND